jgi:LCP family protein required for cell wall assembly
MAQKRLPVILAVVVGVILVCGCSAVVGYMAWSTPLGPSLSGGAAEVNIPTQQVIAANVPVAANTPIPIQTSTQPTPQPAVNCGNYGSENLLIMGVDAPFGAALKGPLSIRIVKIDFSRKTAAVFSFPRDLWLPVTGLEGYGITQARLGESYLIGVSNAGYSSSEATNLVAQILSKNFGAVSNHYITAKMTTLASIIDSVGGITVNIPVPYDARTLGFHYFPAGPYHMTGTLALEYAIAPSSFDQWNGVDRQNLVLMALFQQIFSGANITRIPSLIPQFLQAIATDLSMQQISDLSCIFQQISGGNIAVSGVGPNDVTYGSSGVLYPNTEAIRTKVRQYIAPG